MNSFSGVVIILTGMINLALLAMLFIKIQKIERFQTAEAHDNLNLINQSLNRLSNITDKLERLREPAIADPVTAGIRSYGLENDNAVDKEKKALSLLRRGEDPRNISRKLGISRSEMELLVASEKLGSSRVSNLTAAS